MQWQTTEPMPDEPVDAECNPGADVLSPGNPKEIGRILGWKICIKPDCPFHGAYQHGSNFHKGSSTCKPCKSRYDAAYKAAKRAISSKTERKATEPNRVVCLVNAARRIPGAVSYYMIPEADLKRLVVDGVIQSGDVVVMAKTVSRQQVSFELKSI